MPLVDPWSGAVGGLVSLAVFFAALAQRRRGQRWRWWALSAFFLGWLLALVALLSPLDAAADEGSLSAHVAQHIVLGDLAAPLLLIGLPPVVAGLARRGYRRVTGEPDRRLAPLLRLALSPTGALVLWSVATYVWLSPPIHRLASSDGPGQVLDQLSFLVFGLLVWLAAFDIRRGPSVGDWESLKRSLITCDLPWWARHVYAMASRLAMLPAVALLWLATTSAYYTSSEAPPGGLTQREDQVRAASLMLGFEILLSGLAVVLAFIWLSVSEGRARERGGA